MSSSMIFLNGKLLFIIIATYSFPLKITFEVVFFIPQLSKNSSHASILFQYRCSHISKPFDSAWHIQVY